MAGYELAYDSKLAGFTCQFYHGNLQIGTCENDHTILLLAVRSPFYFTLTTVVLRMCNCVYRMDSGD